MYVCRGSDIYGGAFFPHVRCVCDDQQRAIVEMRDKNARADKLNYDEDKSLVGAAVAARSLNIIMLAYLYK